MADARDVFRRTLKFHDINHFLDQVAGLWADDVATKHSVVVLSREDFHEAIRIRIAACPGVGGEGELAGIIFDASFLQLLFVLPAAATFGCV